MSIIVVNKQTEAQSNENVVNTAIEGTGEGSENKSYWWIVLLIFGIGLAVGLYFVFRPKSSDDNSSTSISSSSPTPSSSPSSPTPSSTPSSSSSLSTSSSSSSSLSLIPSPTPSNLPTPSPTPVTVPWSGKWRVFIETAIYTVDFISESRVKISNIPVWDSELTVFTSNYTASVLSSKKTKLSLTIGSVAELQGFDVIVYNSTNDVIQLIDKTGEYSDAFERFNPPDPPTYVGKWIAGYGMSVEFSKTSSSIVMMVKSDNKSYNIDLISTGSNGIYIMLQVKELSTNLYVMWRYDTTLDILHASIPTIKMQGHLFNFIRTTI